MININLAPLKSAKQFTKNVASALQQANKAKRTPEMIKNLISEGNTIGNTQRQVLQRGAKIVEDSKEIGLSLNYLSNGKTNIKKLQNTTGVLPEVAGLGKNTILGKTNTKRLGNTIKAYENLQNAQKESIHTVNGRTLKRGASDLWGRELERENVNGFQDLSQKAQKRILRADDILSGNPVQVRKLDKALVTERKAKLDELNGLTKGSPEYKNAQQELATLDERLKAPLTAGETHYTLFPNNIQFARGQDRTNPNATYIGLPGQAFNETQRVHLGHSAETSQGHLEHRISHQLTVFGQNTPEILTGNARTNKALLKAQQELETPTPVVNNNAQIFTTPSSTQPTAKGKTIGLPTALGITAGTVGLGVGAGIIQQNLQAPKTNTQEATTEVTPEANTEVPTEVTPDTTSKTPVQPIVVPTPQAKDTATSQLEALKTALPEVKGATLERTEGKHTIAKDTQGYRYIISNLGNGSTQVVKIDDQFPPQQAPEVIVPPDKKGAVIRQIGKANIASKQGYDIQGIDAQAVSDKVKASLPEALLSSTQFGRSAYLDGEGNTQTYDIGTVKLQGKSGRMLTLVANQDGTIKGYEQTPEDIKANRATETTLNKDSVQALLTAGDYSVMAQ